MSCTQEPQAKGAKAIMGVFLHSKGIPDMQLPGQLLTAMHTGTVLSVEG